MGTHLIGDRPGAGTVTGLLAQAEDIDANRYFLVRDAVPHIRNQRREGKDKLKGYICLQISAVSIINLIFCCTEPIPTR